MNAIASPRPAGRALEHRDITMVMPEDEFHEQKVGEAGEIPFPNGTVDLVQREVRYHDGQRSELSGREMALLRYLITNPGRIISREELLLQVWQMNPQFVITRTIDMHVAKLRDKLRDDPQKPAVLMTIRGEGYLWSAPACSCFQAA